MLSRNMGKYYSNGENKNRLIDLTFDFMKEHPSRSFSLLKCNAIFLFGDGICERIYESIKFYQDLSSDHEKADTNVVLHALHSLI